MVFGEYFTLHAKKGKRKVQGVPQSQAAIFPRHQEEVETDKTKQDLNICYVILLNCAFYINLQKKKKKKKKKILLSSVNS